MVLQERRGDDEVGGRKSAAGPQIAFIDQHPGSGLHDQAAGPWLRHPRSIDLAIAKSNECLGIVLGHDAHVAAARRVGVEAVTLQKPT